MTKRVRHPPKDSDWCEHEAPNSKTVCKIRECPKCHKLGCWDWWKDLENVGNRVIRVAHAHFLKPSYEQRRNHNHVIHRSRHPILSGETHTRTFLNNDNEIPWYVRDEFK